MAYNGSRYCKISGRSIEKSRFLDSYRELNEASIEYARKYSDDLDVIGIVPHSLVVYDLIHVNGWNAIHSIGKRTCTEAQWEIRNIARQMAHHINEVSPEVGKYAVPQGKIYGKCPERKSCGLCDK